MMKLFCKACGSSEWRLTKNLKTRPITYVYGCDRCGCEATLVTYEIVNESLNVYVKKHYDLGEILGRRFGRISVDTEEGDTKKMNWHKCIHSAPDLWALCDRLREMDHTVDVEDLWSEEAELNHFELPIFGEDRPAADAPHMEIFSWDDTHELIRAHGVWTIRERELDPTERIIIETQEYLVRTTGEFPVFTDDDVPEFARCACR